MRRLALAVCLLALAACERNDREVAAGGDDSGEEPAVGEGAIAEDCVLAAPACCGCPEYAMPSGEDRCDAVECPGDPGGPDGDDGGGGGCAALVADCADGYCTTACAPVTCDLACPGGFARDA